MVSTLVREDCRIYLTRKCNYNCRYCNLPKKDVEDLTLEKWKKIILNLQEIDVESIRFLGGEPTLYYGLEDLIKYTKKETETYVCLESNSNFPDKRVKDLIDSGLDAYCTDVSSVTDDKLYGRSSGMDKLKKFKKEGLEALIGNVIFSKVNLRELPVIVSHLSKMGVKLNIIPMHFGGQYPHWELRARDVPEKYKFKQDDKKEIELIFKELIELKRHYGMVTNTIKYLLDVSEHVIGFDWHCEKRNQLRLDADGSFRICCDVSGEVQKYNGLTIDKDKMRDFELEWLDSKIRRQCPGCFYPVYYQ